jgi:hypothetical protein
MARHGDESIVVIGVNGHDVRPEFAQNSVQRSVRLGLCRFCWRQDPRATLKEIGTRTREAAKL